MSGKIESETVLISYVVAESVANELFQYLADRRVLPSEGVNPRTLAAYLENRAEAHYAQSRGFAAKIRGVQGREALYSFMRHWAAKWVKDSLPARAWLVLPNSFKVGAPLPVSTTPNSKTEKIKNAT